LQEIVVAVRQVCDLLERTAAGSGEQSDGISQVTQSVHQLDRTTQRNSAVVSQLAGAAEDLERQASELVEAVSAFKIERAEVAAAPRERPAQPALGAPAEA
jgi:methyl-accepting chemotaxis protein